MLINPPDQRLACLSVYSYGVLLSTEIEKNAIGFIIRKENETQLQDPLKPGIPELRSACYV